MKRVWVNREIDEESDIYRHARHSSGLEEFILKRPPRLPEVESIVIEEDGKFYWCKIKFYYSRNYKGDKVLFSLPSKPSDRRPEKLPEEDLDLEEELYDD